EAVAAADDDAVHGCRGSPGRPGPYGLANRLSSKPGGAGERPELRNRDDFQLLSLAGRAPAAPGALRRRRFARRAAASRAARSALAEAAGEADEGTAGAGRGPSASLVGLSMTAADRAQRF